MSKDDLLEILQNNGDLNDVKPNSIWNKKQKELVRYKDQFKGKIFYSNDECDYVRILDAITLPDGDLLLATTYAYGEGSYISYYKLSEISLGKSDKDMEEE